MDDKSRGGKFYANYLHRFEVSPTDCLLVVREKMLLYREEIGYHFDWVIKINII